MPQMTEDLPIKSASTMTACRTIENLGGHNLPTAYPSRRVWLHLTVRDRGGKAIFIPRKTTPISPGGDIIPYSVPTGGGAMVAAETLRCHGAEALRWLLRIDRRGLRHHAGPCLGIAIKLADPDLP